MALNAYALTEYSTNKFMIPKELPRTYLQSSSLPPVSLLQAVVLSIIGIICVPFYWLLARLHGAPGLQVRWECVKLGFRLLINPHSGLAKKTVVTLLLYPLDSTRYFELNFARQILSKMSPQESHLDVSSPQLLFILPLVNNSSWRVDLINPDKMDLAATEKFLRACGLISRCRLYNHLSEDAPLTPASYDLITSISVVEHIPNDKQAIQQMWQLLKSGGRLILTVPCAAQASEQYIDRDEYQLKYQHSSGSFFWQRFYDAELLNENIFSITGQPCRKIIFGERVAGSFLKMAARKRADRYYPFWREPYMVAKEYTYFKTLEDLPGEGVIAMEFFKP